MSVLKVGFIQATNEVDVHWNAPLSFGYLKSYAESAIPGVAEFFVARSVDELVAGQPDVVGISALSQDFCEVPRIAEGVRSQIDATIVLGGQHISIFPHTLPDSVDLGVLGEGEETFAELLEVLAAGNGANTAALSAVRGLIYRNDDGVLTRTPPRPLIMPLDAIPVPDRRFGTTDDQNPYIFSSRGCVYKCAFCASAKYWAKLRMHSAERVVAEVEQVASMDVKDNLISFWDDLFISSRPRLRKIVEMLKERGLTSRFKFSCNVRAELVDDELCELLREGNVVTVGLGAESGSDRILKQLKCGTSSVETNQRALDLLKKYGINCGCTFICGAPGETLPELRQTYRFIMRNYRERKMLFHDMNVLTPMPGTKMWEDAEQAGLVGVTMDWRRLRYLAARCSNLKNVRDWIGKRKQNRSVYLNEAVMPEDSLYRTIAAYEGEVNTLLKTIGEAQSDVGTINRAVHAAVENCERPRYAIKISTPNRTHNNWGDIYYARCLVKALEKRGAAAEIHYRDEWYDRDAEIDVVIHLKGLDHYHVKPNNTNLLWLVYQPPDEVNLRELGSYDGIMCASEIFTERLRTELDIPVIYVPQATDPDHFRPIPNVEKEYDVVFVGHNYNGAPGRQALKDLLSFWNGRKKMGVWGAHWHGYIPEELIKGEFMPWEDLPLLYNRAKIVLNDHRAEMRELGFVNNRTYDASASGAFIISDTVLGMESVMPIETYSSPDNLRQRIDYYLTHEAEREQKAREAMRLARDGYTFDNRAEEIMTFAETCRAGQEKRVAELGDAVFGGQYTKQDCSLLLREASREFNLGRLESVSRLLEQYRDAAMALYLPSEATNATV